jgi:DNA polymerase-3 subunit delta
MLIKLHELKNFIKKNKIDYYLFYGPNSGLIEETISILFKPSYVNNIFLYEEDELLKNQDFFKNNVFNKSFFDDSKLIIVNRATDKIFEIIKNIIEKEPPDIKILVKSSNLDKKSKIRNFFEKIKNAVITPFYEDNHQTLSLLVQKKFREKKINISNEIINLIIERSKGNRINLTNELEKILSYSKKNNKIVLEDVLKITNLVENYEISELVDQNLSKNKKKTINILNENNLNTEENILVLRTFLNKLKRLKKLKINLEKNKNIELVLSSFRPPIFWKDKEIVKQQLNILSLDEIKYLVRKVNNLELKIKKNNQISDRILNNFILENLVSTNNIT